MSSGSGTAVLLVGYLSLFSVAGIAFLFVNLVIGRLLRPQNPHGEKLEIYECGEPAVGSSYVQFDLRFYVVALLFIIFDVEVALFFPWAIVFGKASRFVQADSPAVIQDVQSGEWKLSGYARGLLEELGVTRGRDTNGNGEWSLSATAAETARPATVGNPDVQLKDALRRLAWITVVDILAFFGVLMVGFLYVWRRGDLDWVRATTQQRTPLAESGETAGEQPVAEMQLVS